VVGGRRWGSFLGDFLVGEGLTEGAVALRIREGGEDLLLLEGGGL
jgi:hypothetical protein